MELFLPILGDNSRKSDWNWQVWLQKSLSNLVRSFSDVESQRRCQPLTNAFGAMGMLGTDWTIIMSMQPSLATMKTSTECKKALHLREIKRSHRQVARKRRHGSKMQGRKWELFISFPLTASPLTFTFTYHSKSRGCSQSYSVNQHKNSSYLRTKQCPLWLHVSFFNKKSSHTRGTTTPKCTLPWHLVRPCNSHLLQSTPPSAEPHNEFWYGHLDFDKTITWWLKIRQKKKVKHHHISSISWIKELK